MAVTFRAAGTTSAGSSASRTVSYPAGVLSGDLLVLQYFRLDMTGVVTTPSGWTLLLGPVAMSGGPTNGQYLFWRVAGASEPTTVTVTSTGGGNAYAIMAAYSGTDPVAPVDVYTTANLPTSGSTMTTPSVTTTQANTRLLRIYWAYQGAAGVAPPGTDTERYDSFQAAPSVDMQLADSAQAAAGTSGTTTATASGGLFGGLGATVAVTGPIVAGGPSGFIPTITIV